MSAREQSDLIELSAEQILTVRGAANAIVDAVDDPGIEIDDQFDPVRRDHLAAASEELAEALTTLAPGGTWRGRMPPSEQQALRDAIGAVEAMATPPESERLRSLGYRVDDNDVQALGTALDGVPAPDREDLAFSDFRFGGYEGALQDRTDYSKLNSKIRAGFNDPPEPQAADFIINALGNARRMIYNDYCTGEDMNLTERIGKVAAIGDDLFVENIDAAREDLTDEIEAEDCYTRMDERRIIAGIEMLFERARRGESTTEAAFGIAEMIAWAQSNRLREQRIGLR